MTAQVKDLEYLDAEQIEILSDGDGGVSPYGGSLWQRAAEQDPYRNMRVAQIAEKLIADNGQRRDLGWTEDEVRGYRKMAL